LAAQINPLQEQWGFEINLMAMITNYVQIAQSINIMKLFH